jgi:hypothetical protein
MNKAAIYGGLKISILFFHTQVEVYQTTEEDPKGNRD